MRKEQVIAHSAPLSLFYSYAHEDEELRDQLEKHLRQLQRRGLISEWHDRKILPGEAWAGQIDMHLETSSIILLLVSPDFLASDYCYEHEMQHVLERHKSGEVCIVPIILRACDWQHSPLKEIQCLPRDGRPVTQWQDLDEVFNSITQSLRRIIEKQQTLIHPPAPLSPLNRQNRIRLLKRVRAIWIDGLLTQSLHQAATIELHLQNRPDVLENPWRLQVQELDRSPLTLPDGTTIVQVYDRAEGELLILGEPGAGKTTLLLELASVLLERAEQDERLRMPIIFNLSSWAEKRQPLSIWLVEELWTKYQVPRKIGQNWIDTDQVLPLLDGLDEVAKEARSACTQQINDYYQSRLEHGSSPLVVCCRSEEYAALSTRLMLQHAVSILPLTDEQINSYLEQAGEQVQGLRQALNEDAELHSLARQPLMLTIFTFAYRGASVAEIPTGVADKEMQQTIFARYVEHMLKRRGQPKRWQSEQVMKWLTFLAKQMQRHDQTIFSVENLQPNWLSKKWRNLFQWCLGLLIGLFAGIFIGFAAVQNFGLITGSFVGLAAGLIFGLLIGLVVWQDIGIDPIDALTWSWKEARSTLFLLMAIELVYGIIIGLGLGLIINFFLGLFVGLAFCLMVGLFSGLLIVGLTKEQIPERFFLSPNEGTRHSGRNGLMGLIFGLISGLILTPFSGLLSGELIGLVLGLSIGRVLGLDIFINHFILRFFLSLRGDLPWNLVPFLDDAAERLLLRKVGGSYIFVHRLLLDYFAGLGEKDG